MRGGDGHRATTFEGAMATRRVGLLRLVDLSTYEAIGTADEVTRPDGYALEVCHLRGEGIGREVIGEGC